MMTHTWLLILGWTKVDSIIFVIQINFLVCEIALPCRFQLRFGAAKSEYNSATIIDYTWPVRPGGFACIISGHVHNTARLFVMLLTDIPVAIRLTL